jgi:hypothetical protein
MRCPLELPDPNAFWCKACQEYSVIISDMDDGQVNVWCKRCCGFHVSLHVDRPPPRNCVFRHADWYSLPWPIPNVSDPEEWGNLNWWWEYDGTCGGGRKVPPRYTDKIEDKKHRLGHVEWRRVPALLLQEGDG